MQIINMAQMVSDWPPARHVTPPSALVLGYTVAPRFSQAWSGVSTAETNTTHFGFSTVEAKDKARMVAEVFHSVAGRYDLMNDLMSMGVHRLWKRLAIEYSGVRRGHQVLDLAGGTGDITALLAPRVGDSGRVVIADINDSMLNVGRQRLRDRGIVANVEYVQANAEQLPFASNSFDLVTIAFGLRNVTDKGAALREMVRVLRPGGRALVLEFSKPIHRPLSRVYDLYSFEVLPRLGEFFAKDAASYRYLAESIRMHPDQQTLAALMTDSGFDQVSHVNFTGGIVALHRGFKF